MAPSVHEIYSDSFRGPEASVRPELSKYFEHLKEDMEEVTHEFKSMFKHMVESPAVKDERLAKQDEEQERSAQLKRDHDAKTGRGEASGSGSESRPEHGERQESARSTVGGRGGGGFSLMRTDRIDPDADEDASDEYEDEEESTPATSRTTRSPPASIRRPSPSHRSSSASRSTSNKPPRINVGGRPTGRKRDTFRQKIFGNNSHLSARPSSSDEPINSSDSNLLSVPPMSSIARAPSSSSSAGGGGTHSRTPSIRFSDSPLGLTPTNTISPLSPAPTHLDIPASPYHRRAGSTSSTTRPILLDPPMMTAASSNPIEDTSGGGSTGIPLGDRTATTQSVTFNLPQPKR